MSASPFADVLSALGALFSGAALVIVARVGLSFGEWKGRVDARLESIERAVWGEGRPS